ncbi:MAG: hypothetical protein JST00_13235 [Deltaproteobacteria bacterium]|nr:hypothetical protein [Deltaproteobacteria bacterium]
MSLGIRSHVLVGVGLSGALALFACNRDNVDRQGGVLGDRTNAPRTTTTDNRDRAGETTTTGATVGVSNEGAIDRLVAARCQREATCKNIGSDKHFSSYDVCSRELRSRVQDDLRASECPKGIDGKELDECLESIRTESCNNPLDTISRLAACRSGDLCLKVSDTNH